MVFGHNCENENNCAESNFQSFLVMPLRNNNASSVTCNLVSKQGDIVFILHTAITSELFLCNLVELNEINSTVT